MPYIQNLVQFVGDAAYLYFICTYPRVSTNTEHAKNLQKQTPGLNIMSQTNLLGFTRNYN